MLFNIFVGLIVIGLTVIIQGYGTIFWVERKRKFLHQEPFFKNIRKLLISTSIFVLFIHLIQASLWALVYMYLPGITEFQTFEKSLYFSLVTFTTLGYGDITISSANRVLSGLEAINGITLIGWSTAFMFSVFQQVLRNKYQGKDQK
ncbi:MAG: two pore domain potassium channel family protein [Flavobacteriales bacterium]|nr:two pore domain potassium channel family protein [Flavobacteriales bacterium]